MLTLVPCPECCAPAEVTDRFSLASTDGPVDHVEVVCAAGHHFRMPSEGVAAKARTTITGRLRGGTRAHRARGRAGTVSPPGLPRTIQLCIHCQENPAGFWVSRKGGKLVRRPWCLSCCQQLDQDRCDVIPFGG